MSNLVRFLAAKLLQFFHCFANTLDGHCAVTVRSPHYTKIGCSCGCLFGEIRR